MTGISYFREKCFWMNLNEKIAESITDCFNGNNWTGNNLQQALEDINYKMAQTKVPFTENTIAMLVYHLKYSNEVILKRTQGAKAEYDNENEGFKAPKLFSNQDWQALISETFSSAEKLAAAIRNYPSEKLDKEILPGFSTAYKNFEGISEHAHYHLGQIVMIKKYLQKQIK